MRTSSDLRGPASLIKSEIRSALIPSLITCAMALIVTPSASPPSAIAWSRRTCSRCAWGSRKRKPPFCCATASAMTARQYVRIFVSRETLTCKKSPSNASRLENAGAKRPIPAEDLLGQCRHGRQTRARDERAGPPGSEAADRIIRSAHEHPPPRLAMWRDPGQPSSRMQSTEQPHPRGLGGPVSRSQPPFVPPATSPPYRRTD